MAIWATSDDQAAICDMIAVEVGKSVPVYSAVETYWADGEKRHQRFFG